MYLLQNIPRVAAPQVLGSLPGRVSVDVGLHQKSRPTYLSRVSQRSLRHLLPTYPSSSRPAITTAVTSMLYRYITFNLIHTWSEQLILARRRRRKNRMWPDSVCALFSRAPSPIRRGLPSLVFPSGSLCLRAFSRSDPLAAGASTVARAFDRSLLVSDLSTMFNRYIS